MHSEFKSATQIYVNPIYFEVQQIFRNDQNWWNRKNCPKFFHMIFFAFWIQICNQNLCKYHTFWNTTNVEKWSFSHSRTWWPKSMKSEKLLEFFHRVIFAFWIQICNPNLCKCHIFWITANIEMWSFFAYPDLMTKIGEIGKISQNSFIG